MTEEKGADTGPRPLMEDYNADSPWFISPEYEAEYRPRPNRSQPARPVENKP